MAQKVVSVATEPLCLQQICIESRNNDFTAVEALKPENKHLNRWSAVFVLVSNPVNWCRYRDVYPYDHSRVGVEGVPSTDYVNASLVKVEAVARSYILTQVQLTLTRTGYSYGAYQLYTGLYLTGPTGSYHVSLLVPDLGAAEQGSDHAEPGHGEGDTEVPPGGAGFTVE